MSRQNEQSKSPNDSVDKDVMSTIEVECEAVPIAKFELISHKSLRPARDSPIKAKNVDLE